MLSRTCPACRRSGHKVRPRHEGRTTVLRCDRCERYIRLFGLEGLVAMVAEGSTPDRASSAPSSVLAGVRGSEP